MRAISANSIESPVRAEGEERRGHTYRLIRFAPFGRRFSARSIVAYRLIGTRLIATFSLADLPLNALSTATKIIIIYYISRVSFQCRRWGERGTGKGHRRANQGKEELAFAAISPPRLLFDISSQFETHVFNEMLSKQRTVRSNYETISDISVVAAR